MKFICLHFETSNLNYSLQQDKCLFVYVLLAEIFFPMADDQTFSVFASKEQNEGEFFC